MKKNQIHLINYSADKIKHCILKLVKNTYTVSSGTDLEKLKTSTKKCKNETDAYYKYSGAVSTKMADGYIYKNTNITPKPGELLLHMRAPNRSISRLLDIHPKGKILAIGSIIGEYRGAEIHLLDKESGVLTLVYSVKPPNKQVALHTVHFNAAGDKIFFQLDTEVTILDIATKKLKSFAGYGRNAYRVDGPNPHVAAAMFDARRERYMYFVSGHVKICDRSMKPIFKLKLNYGENTVESKLSCISPSGKYLAVYQVSRFIVYGHDEAASDKTNQIDIWDIDLHKLIKSIQVEEWDLTRIAFNPAETEIIFLKGICEGPGFYDIKTGKFDRWFKDKNGINGWRICYSFAYSPNGEILAVGQALFDAKKHKKQLRYFTGSNRNPYKVMFSADGELFIEGGDFGEISIRKAVYPKFPKKNKHVE